jgi:hypothetical protein
VSGAEVGVIFCKLNVVQINKAESYRWKVKEMTW